MEDTQSLTQGLTKQITLTITYEEFKELKKLEDKFSRRKIFMAGVKLLVDNLAIKVEISQ